MAAKTSTYPNGVWRIAYSGATLAPTSPPLFYLPSPSPCSLNAGAGDGGFQVRSADGLCWIADFPDPKGVDIRWWGQVGTADDTAVWQIIDASMGNSGWPVAKTAIVPAISTPAKLVFSHIQRITGTPHVTTLTCISTQGTSGPCWNYDGTGPFQLDNLVVGCQTYIDTTAPGGHMVQPPNCGTVMFQVSPATVTSYSGKITVRNVDLSGGTTAFATYQTADVDLEFDKAYDFYAHEVVVSGQNVASTGADPGTLRPDSNVRVVIHDCRDPGQYCLSTPVDFPVSTSSYTGPWTPARDIWFDIRCTGAGFIGSKGCVDATGNAVDVIHGKLVAINPSFGFESKVAGNMGGGTPPTVGANPPVFQNRWFDADVHMEYDLFDTCALFPYEIQQATGSYPINNLYARINCTYTPAFTWLPNFPYNKGDVYLSTDNNTYIVLKTNNGVSGSTAPTGGMRNNFSLADGNLVIQCICAPAPAEATNVIGVEVEALNGADLDVTVHGVKTGVQLSPRGETNTISNSNIKLRGEATNYCVRDVYITNAYAVNQTIDHLTLDGSCIVTGQAQCDPTAMDIGEHNSPPTLFINYTNLTIRGDWLSPNIGVGPDARLDGD